MSQEDNKNEAQSVIPATVKDVRSYKQWLKLKDNKALSKENRMIDTSDPTLVVDPEVRRVKIEKEILGLGGDEQTEILQRVRAYHTVTMRVRELKRKAFGIKRDTFHAELMMGILDEREGELLEYFGNMMNDREIHRIVIKDWGYDVPLQTVSQFRRNHKDQVDLKIKEFQDDWQDIRLVHKKARLQELSELYASRKDKYALTQTQRDYEMMLKTLTVIRQEVEDPTLKIDHQINAKLELTINTHIQQEVMSGLTINDIIIARVAAKMGINPAFLLARLHGSMYAKHAGFVKPDAGLEGQEISYPSAMVYNWSSIEKQHKEIGDVGLEKQKWEDVPHEEIESIKSTGEILRERIAQKKREIAQSKSRVKENTKNS